MAKKRTGGGWIGYVGKSPKDSGVGASGGVWWQSLPDIGPERVAQVSKSFPAHGAAVRWLCGAVSARRQAAYAEFLAWDRVLRLAERLPVENQPWAVSDVVDE